MRRRITHPEFGFLGRESASFDDGFGGESTLGFL